MRYIWRETRHQCKQLAFWVSVAVALLCFIFEHRDYYFIYLKGTLMHHSDVYYQFVMPFEFGLFFYLVPMIAIPAAALPVIDEIKSGVIRFQLHRTSTWKYIAQRLASCWLSAMLPMLLGCLLFLGFSMATEPMIAEEESQRMQNSIDVEAIRRMAFAYNGMPYFFFIIGQATLSAGLWGMIGLGIALVFMDKGTTLIDGFLLFWVWEWLGIFLDFPFAPFSLFFTSPNSSIENIWIPWLQTTFLLSICLTADACLMRYRCQRL